MSSDGSAIGNEARDVSTKIEMGAVVWTMMPGLRHQRHANREAGDSSPAYDVQSEDPTERVGRALFQHPYNRLWRVKAQPTGEVALDARAVEGPLKGFERRDDLCGEAAVLQHLCEGVKDER